jgi:hypothetical protein
MKIHRMTMSASDVEHVPARLQAIDETGNEREDRVDERYVEHSRRHPRHQLLESGVTGVGDAFAVLERLDDVVLDLGELADELCEEAEVVRTCSFRQACGVLGRQLVRPRLRIELDDSADGHAGEPLAHVPLVETGSLCDLRTRRGWEPGHRLEQPCAVPGTRQERERAPVQVAEHRSRELLDLRRVDLCRCHANPPCRVKTTLRRQVRILHACLHSSFAYVAPVLPFRFHSRL